MNWAIIMAGGSGTRFWPLSNSEHPKQFLHLLGEKTPTLSCVERLLRFIELPHILIVASERHRQILKESLPNFPLEQVLWEPEGRNTAPCIAWATTKILRQDSEARIGVFPSDHEISDISQFVSCLEEAYLNSTGRIVLFGITPTRPETGYGYIEEGAKIGDVLREVASFREKPEIEKAEAYIKAGRFLWNSGMFIFDGQVMYEELTRFVPQIVQIAEEILDYPERLKSRFFQMMSISIDYAVMEHTSKAAVIRASFSWDDLGTWESVRRYYSRDKNGNSSKGEARLYECHNTFTYSGDERVIAAIGLSDVVIVSTPEAVLVMDGKHSQDVRKVVK